MFQTNAARNEIIYPLWEKGYTVDQISHRTTIPRSTVGYYVRKFNKLAKEGKPVVFPRKKRSDSENIFAASIKILSLQKALEMIENGKSQDLYYMLAALKLLKEFGVSFTPEEKEAFSSLNLFQNKMPRSKSLSELVNGESKT
ncbi:MAG: hypothetical protein JSW01_02360 [Candidatus Bathyarchaeota archaeon]|nr:MAG: hypothetical protein JSW01_02360 [Candidatus Bathyarchaeota archaeon]